ncbi:hypothetical protein GCM10007933_15340 [Zoogloea oryzae]|uniref:Integrase catalytic domain-containing protein n=1 Tax=Zoogloea oryzae TaxID=310767 RepID=A0ABQ6F939_9RHOO|nr:hypothetical protein [Zoogloea oryzae]GLT22078.1 hypothetical protein GCM10007933_15340 [Zoogloea oryzae]
MLQLNEVLMPAPDRTTSIDGIVRVVGISHDGKTVGLIQLDVWPLKAPYLLPLASIDPDEDDNGIIRVTKFDTNLPLSKDKLSDKKKERLKAVSKQMQSTMADLNMVMDAGYRNREFERIAKRDSVSVRTIQRQFYDYLWGGMVEMAFLGPKKAQRPAVTPQNPGTQKRGPKPRNTEKEDRGSAPLSQVREQLIKGAKKFYLNGAYTEAEAFVLTKKKFFSNGKKATRVSGKKVELDDLLLPPSELPSRRQFHYIITLLRETEGDRETKPRDAKPRRKRTVRRGRARDGVPGPGYRYEIDATRIQIRLVSRYNPAQLMREATLYIIIDVWSGSIVGYALSLEPPSWFLAAKALYNCFTPKSKVFKRLELPYGDEDWVSQHLPTRLAADRGEFVSDKAGVVPEIGIEVEIMPPMCPERKGSVEGKFEKVKHGDNFYLKPGKHKKNPQRREKDGKKEAAYTLMELEQLIVEIILDLNNDPVPVENIPADAVKAGVEAITYGGLFAWGLKNRTGFTRVLPDKVAENELMLRAQATVTPEGIRYQKQTYVSNDLLESGLLAKATTQGNFPIDIRYDDLVGDRIRYLDPLKQDWADALNNNPDVLRLHTSFWEIEQQLFKAEDLHSKAEENNISNKHEKASAINKRARAAVTRAKVAKATTKQSNSKQAINQNTAVEIAADRSKRLLAEQKSLATALAVKATQPAPHLVQTSSASSAQPAKSVGQRALELLKKKNAPLDK